MCWGFLVRIIHVLFFLAIAIVLSACITYPPYSGLKSYRFVETSIPVERMAIIFSSPFEYREKVARPMAQRFPGIFAEAGIDGLVEVQTVNPFELGGDVSFSKVKQARPDAYLIIKFVGASSGSGYVVLDIVLELLDSKGKGCWRASLALKRLNNIELTAEQMAKDVLNALLSDQAIRIHKGE